MKNELCLVGLNYKTAPVEIREAFALSDPELLENGVLHINDVVMEFLILSTCNRVEILAVVKDKDACQHLFEKWAEASGQTAEELIPYTYTYWGEEAIRHLFSVASSLDSMVLGEPQILGQLKTAYKDALHKGNAKTIINRLLHKAFSVAKRVRTETGIASSAVSISYAAIELAKRIFENMSEVRVLLIGAGEMAELAATYLLQTGIESITVANRTVSRAVELAERYNGTAIGFDTLFEHLALSDIIISSTAANEPIIHARQMKKVLQKRKHKPMFFIDIAVPRDIDPSVNTLDNVYLYDIDDLKDVVEENLAQRQQEAQKAAKIVQQETDFFVNWLKSLSLQPTIVNLIDATDALIQAELQKTLKRFGPVSADQQEALDAMAMALTKKLTHSPITFLKRHIEETTTTTNNINILRRIFNLDNDVIPPHAHAAGKRCQQSAEALAPTDEERTQEKC